MIVPKTTQPPFEADLSELTQEQQENIKSTRYRSDTDDYEVEFNEKYERILLRDQMREEVRQRIDMIADIIEGAQGEEWANDKQKIADDIRNANAQGNK